jgi:hypothetical protein
MAPRARPELRAAGISLAAPADQARRLARLTTGPT